ncbi:MAG TPA: DUF1318 domain-containing protein [Polyangiaceae bacterium]|nr:DUF1318 domain-containing protein [Polyangiaceae bacterium]
MKHLLRALLYSLPLLPGCVAPNVVVVDQKTALEEQAAGGYPALENDLEQAGMTPAPEPFAREELAGKREQGGGSALGELAELYVKSESDADAIDRLLLQRCIGEARTGLLEPRPSDCVGAADATEMARLLGRENLHRRQLWQLLANERQVSTERVQPVWREHHLEQVVCGGLVEAAEGRWEPKSC